MITAAKLYVYRSDRERRVEGDREGERGGEECAVMSVSARGSMVSQDGPSSGGNERRNTRVQRAVRISSIVAQEVSGTHTHIHFKPGTG